MLKAIKYLKEDIYTLEKLIKKEKYQELQYVLEDIKDGIDCIEDTFTEFENKIKEIESKVEDMEGKSC